MAGEHACSDGQLRLELDRDAEETDPGSVPSETDGERPRRTSCAVCGASLDGRRRHAIYCSAACRSAARDVERAARRTDPERPPCPICGEPMAGRRQGAIFCSPVCRARAWAEAHAGPRGRNDTDQPAETVRNRNHASVRRVTLTKPEAAGALGISVDSFERHVQPELRVIRRGRMRLIPLTELERWAERSASLTLDRAVR